MVRDRGQRWEIYEVGCATCVPGTYATIRTQPVTFEEAPDGAPDLASIGEEGLFFDAKARSPMGIGWGAYRQRDVIYMVHVSEAVPRASWQASSPHSRVWRVWSERGVVFRTMAWI